MLYQIVSILDSILGSNQKFANNEYYYSCPFCNHYRKKLAVNLIKRKWQCWKCGARGGTLLSLIRRLDVSPKQIAELTKLLHEELPKFKATKDDITRLVLPYEYRPLYMPQKSIESKHALAYLRNRNITDADIIRYQLGYCETGEYAGRVIIPSFDDIGVLNFFVGRAYHDYALTYKNPMISRNIIGFDFHINWKLPIVLCEGVFDAIAIKRNAIPLFGKTVSKRLHEKILKEKVRDMYVALDRDAVKDALRISERFMNQNINVHLIELPDKDPSILGFENVQYIFRQTPILSLSGLVARKISTI